jgi:hypothetical protein
MSSVSPMERNEAKSEAEWLRRIVARGERALEKLPEPYWLKGDWPVWVQNVGREVTKAYYPTAKLKVSANWEPGEVGAMFGQLLAYFDFFADMCEVPEEKVSWEKLRILYGKDIKERAAAYAKKFSEEFVPDLERALKFALRLAIEQDYRACAKFFSAFGRAIERRPSSASDIGRTNTRIYVVLLVAWRSVEKLGSIPALHRALCKIFGNHVVGDLKRVEKICERIELSYREIARRTE